MEGARPAHGVRLQARQARHDRAGPWQEEPQNQSGRQARQALRQQRNHAAAQPQRDPPQAKRSADRNRRPDGRTAHENQHLQDPVPARPPPLQVLVHGRVQVKPLLQAREHHLLPPSPPTTAHLPRAGQPRHPQPTDPHGVRRGKARQASGYISDRVSPIESLANARVDAANSLGP